MTAAILAITVDAPHNEPGANVLRFSDLGSFVTCERTARQLMDAKRRGQPAFSLFDAEGGTVATLALHRVTGVRVYGAIVDQALPPTPPDITDRKILASGG